MSRLKPWIVAALAAALTLSIVAGASAQGAPPGPAGFPSIFVGTVTSPDGDVALELPVHAFVGDKDCTEGTTTETYRRAGQQETRYFVRVDSASLSADCGVEGTEVRFRIGERWATQTGTWNNRIVPQTLDLTLAPETTTATVHVAVWRSVSDSTRLFLSTRPEGGSWTTHDGDGPLSMSVFGSGRFERSDDLIRVDVDLGDGSTATVHVAVWRSVSDPTRLFLSTRPEGGSWTTHDGDGPLSMSVFGSGRFERSDDLIRVDVVLQ